MKFTVHGARGSYPVAGTSFARYGGRTSCFSLETSRGFIIVDAGTGIADLGDALAAHRVPPPTTILFTHIHLDHLIGLPAFKPLLNSKAQVTLMADPSQLPEWQRHVSLLMDHPFWPLPLLRDRSAVRFEDLRLRHGEAYGLDGVSITTLPVRHPQGCVAYRLSTPSRVLVIATDREHGDPAGDAALIKFCRGADVLLHDAQFTPEELPARRGWGHSTWEHAVAVAKEAGVKELLLTSHDPGHSDEMIDSIVAAARKQFPDTRAAADGLVIA
ncbi:MAG: MBL fold metallo-hydrolase [Candidatus Omnitrophica bacterium]|nr:MBL fold metallo-hydrolase [Candidatus Omnitrophota bacterium]